MPKMNLSALGHDPLLDDAPAAAPAPAEGGTEPEAPAAEASPPPAAPAGHDPRLDAPDGDESPAPAAEPAAATASEAAGPEPVDPFGAADRRAAGMAAAGAARAAKPTAAEELAERRAAVARDAGAARDAAPRMPPLTAVDPTSGSDGTWTASGSVRRLDPDDPEIEAERERRRRRMTGGQSDLDDLVSSWVFRPPVGWPGWMPYPSDFALRRFREERATAEMIEAHNLKMEAVFETMKARAAQLNRHLKEHGDPKRFAEIDAMAHRRLMRGLPPDPLAGFRFALLIDPQSNFESAPIRTWGHDFLVTRDGARIRPERNGGLSTDRATVEAARLMVMEAHQRGWATIEVKGGPEFCEAARAAMREFGMGGVVIDRGKLLLPLKDRLGISRREVILPPAPPPREPEAGPVSLEEAAQAAAGEGKAAPAGASSGKAPGGAAPASGEARTAVDAESASGAPAPARAAPGSAPRSAPAPATSEPAAGPRPASPVAPASAKAAPGSAPASPAETADDLDELVDAAEADAAGPRF